MAQYPNIQELGKRLFNGSDHSLHELYEALENRLKKIQTLVESQGITIVDNKKDLQGNLQSHFLSDTDFLLASSYLLSQTIMLLKNAKMRLVIKQKVNNAEENIESYIALRNHLEHGDPIFGSQDLPYYEMQTKELELIASAISELMTHYKPKIVDNPLNYSKDDLHLLEEEAKNLSAYYQEKALDPSGFL